MSSTSCRKSRSKSHSKSPRRSASPAAKRRRGRPFKDGVKKVQYVRKSRREPKPKVIKEKKAQVKAGGTMLGPENIKNRRKAMGPQEISDLEAQEIAALLSAKPKVQPPPRKDNIENLSEESYHPPGFKKVKEKQPLTKAEDKTQQYQIKQPKVFENYEIARLILLTPTDYTQAIFASQPIVMLKIRGQELTKLINNSWHFIRNSQLFYNYINHFVPEITGNIVIDSEFISPEEAEEENEPNEAEIVKQIGEDIYIEEDSESFNLENILGINKDIINEDTCLQ